MNSSALVCLYDLKVYSKEDDDDKKDMFIKVEQMNESNKHSFYTVNGDNEDSVNKIFTKF